MIVKYEAVVGTEYQEALADKELQGWIKSWYGITQKYTDLEVVTLNIDKRNYKKVNPYMLMYKFREVK